MTDRWVRTALARPRRRLLYRFERCDGSVRARKSLWNLVFLDSCRRWRTLKLLGDRERGSRIVVVLTDTGLKYLSTPLFEV